jgi:putative sigma-54 modulation protein
MQVIISARGLPVSRIYKDALACRLARLEPMLPKIVEAKIVLSKEKHRRTAALTLIAKDHTLRSEETAGDLAVAVDNAVDALVRQVKAIKDRLKNRKGRGRPRRGAADALAPPPAAEEPAPGVVVSQVALKPMSLAEAVEQLRVSPDECLLFTHARTDSVSVLYRRRNGGLGLIEPQP